MSTPLQPLITKAGLAAVWRADSTGIAAQITHIVLGTSSYTPLNTQTALRTQVGKYAISDGQRLSDTLIHVTAVADDAKAFWVREVGFLLADGTLFAVWSHATEPLTYKSANAELLLAYDLSLAALPANSVTITSTGAGLNLTLSAELAALAAASIAGMVRDQNQQDALDSQDKLNQKTGQQILSLMDRMLAVEKQQESDRDGLLTAIAANATGLISLQTLFSQAHL